MSGSMAKVDALDRKKWKNKRKLAHAKFVWGVICDDTKFYVKRVSRTSRNLALTWTWPEFFRTVGHEGKTDSVFSWMKRFIRQLVLNQGAEILSYSTRQTPIPGHSAIIPFATVSWTPMLAIWHILSMCTCHNSWHEEHSRNFAGNVLGFPQNQTNFFLSKLNSDVYRAVWPRIR